MVPIALADSSCRPRVALASRPQEDDYSDEESDEESDEDFHDDIVRQPACVARTHTK